MTAARPLVSQREVRVLAWLTLLAVLVVGAFLLVYYSGEECGPGGVEPASQDEDVRRGCAQRRLFDGR